MLCPASISRHHVKNHFLLLLRSVLTVLAIVVISPAFAEEIRFNTHIRPLLSDRCFSCHGPDEKHREADLRLDLREGATGESSGPVVIVPGKPSESEILKRITSTDPDTVMPPPASKKPRLMASEIELIKKWIEAGAAYEGHWAFLSVRDERLPNGTFPNSNNLTDHFIRDRLQRAGLSPSPEADRATLIRRVTLDLTGLLPTPEEVEQFVTDPSPAAYERLIDRLLASPHYGERWGRHWLDQARYADSNGYAIDAAREAWPYRDWVIEALNSDLPFDQFTVEQLAGDLLPNPTKSQLIATGFHRNTLINQEGGTDREQFRVEAAMDRVSTTGAVWLGLTVGCAQCHTHKFDPITQREYYQLFAFFNAATDANDVGPTVEVLRGEVFGHPVSIPPDPPAPADAAKDQQKKDQEKKPPTKKDNPNVAKQMVMRDLPKPRETFVLTRGDFTRPDKNLGAVSPGVLNAVAPKLFDDQPAHSRLDLAKWLTHPQNPLVARVAINRIWMRFFGRGLVETDEDFGLQGSPPSHPELLDSLSREFVRNHWSVKTIQRLIVTSATYRQSSRHSQNQTLDPDNKLLWRQNRVRLEAEIARDAALSASGLLQDSIGGRSVHPPQPDGVYAFTQVSKPWPTDAGADRYRRALYTFYFRSAPYPLFTTFDAPDFQSVCTRRLRSNTPLQALTLANDPAFTELAQGLAYRLAIELPGDPRVRLDDRIRLGGLLCLSRSPSDKELRVLREYALRQLDDLSHDADAAEALTTAALRAVATPAGGASLVLMARALLNTDNFITRE